MHPRVTVSQQLLACGHWPGSGPPHLQGALCSDVKAPAVLPGLGHPTPRHYSLQHVPSAPNRPRQAAASWDTAAWSLCSPCRPQTPDSRWRGPLCPVRSPSAGGTVPLLRGDLPHDLTQASSPPLQPPTWKARIRGLPPAPGCATSRKSVGCCKRELWLPPDCHPLREGPPFPAGAQDPFLGSPPPPCMHLCSLPWLALEPLSSVVPCPPTLRSLRATSLMHICHSHFPAERPSPAESPKPHSSFHLGLSEFGPEFRTSRIKQVTCLPACSFSGVTCLEEPFR